jgi:threonine dehydrogenase-like Zn-dependent dehydrogenase
MESLALWLYGEKDLRLERFELPEMTDDDILADIVSNSVCMSDYKAAVQGARHKRVPDDVAHHPTIVGHEFCGRILKVGRNWRHAFRAGQKYSVQPALNVPGREQYTIGYAWRTIGGYATRILIPRTVMERECLLAYDGDDYYKASLAEPLSCIIGAFRSSYRCTPGHYDFKNGVKPGGGMAILAGAGPMGAGAVELALRGDTGRPARLVVTDVDGARLARARRLFPAGEARRAGVDLHFLNAAETAHPVAAMRALNGGRGFDDVFVFAPLPGLIEQASALLGDQGCLNFFAGPTDPAFTAPLNFYDVHYSGHHVVGSSGGNARDMLEAIALSEQGRVDPSILVTHVGGLDAARETVMNLPSLPGGKKLIYTHCRMPLTAIDDFAGLGRSDPFYAALAGICQANNGLWCGEAERYLLAHAPRLENDASCPACLW